ncbi:hypothetical protein Clacol_009775 [Clathrus columnatus]|uniref:Dynamin-type G domain-containing protein n=1 Tax=Clathrus columnatus TaxID=1419009 RepID=A0AAV5ALE8_9AGAM|nr:hypothetical protein Clacol_009775 [Clathrus columnatus]
MSQAYPIQSRSLTASPPPIHEKILDHSHSQTEDMSLRDDDVQKSYLNQKNRLATAIDSAKNILNDFKIFNKDSWVIRYPTSLSTNEPLKRTTSTDDIALKTKPELQRSATFATGSASVEQSQDADNSSQAAELQDSKTNFHVLRLDLKLGMQSTSPAALVSQLEKASIAKLLDERITAAINHIDKLRLRIEDTSSKVLVTGDLNAGKSTFVNALLRRQVMPVDQQPCTTMFCEVHDAVENNGLEEVHLFKEGVTYDVKDENTFVRAPLEDLENIVSENEDVKQLMRLYVADARGPTKSLLHNGVVDIALIDAPGLNRDSLKTTALFARQEEIDVVVFVVSAENHFTLSAKEFLWNASNEKAYLFIVVNRYDQIRDKAKCKRLILEQIKQLSPRTYDDAEDLVHFVDSSASQLPTSSSVPFDNLENCLRSFVLVKRAKSKLHPVSTYLSNLLSDVDLLSAANAVIAKAELEQARNDLERVRPVLQKMTQGREALEDGIVTIEETGSAKAARRTRAILNAALERIGNGEPGVDKGIKLPTYPGLFSLWEYTKEVRRALLQSLDMAVELAQDEARVTTTSCITEIAALGEKHLPPTVERSKRIFMPERMFLPKKGGKSTRSTTVAGGIHGLGIGLAQQTDMLEITFLDVFDFRRFLATHFGDEETKHQAAEADDDSSTSTISVISVGLGALTMVGGKTLGMHGLIEGVARLTNLFENETVRRWAAPVIGAFTIGLTAYFIIELPHTIPRSVGRRIRSSLIRPAEGESEDLMYVNAHSLRVARETRKVLRMASWDLKERFRVALDEHSKEANNAEELERKANSALEWFKDVQKRTSETRTSAGL